MQQRDSTKSDHEQGLYERYRVERIDGRTDEGGGYFVLRTHNLTNDKPETAALRAYAAAVRPTHPALAADIEAQLPDDARAPSLRDDLVELGRLREQVGAYQRWSKELAAYLVEHHKQPEVDDRSVAILDGYHVGLTAVAGPSAGGENTLAAAVRLLKLAAERGAFMAFARTADDTICGDLLALADDIELNLDRTVEPENARQNIALFRRAAATIEVAESQLRVLGGQLDQIAESVSPGVRETRIDDGKDRSWKAPDTVELVREFVEQRRVLPPDLVTRAAAAASALDECAAKNLAEGDDEIAWTAAKVLREIVDAADKQPEVVETRFTEVHYAIGEANEPRTVLRFEGLPDVSLPDSDVVTLVRERAATTSTGWRAGDRCTVDGEGDEVFTLTSDIDDRTAMLVNASGETHGREDLRKLRRAPPAHETSKTPAADLSERANVMVTNLLHITKNKKYLSPAGASAIKSAAALLAELAEALQPSAFFWVVDEFCDNEGETFGIAIPATQRVDDALARWAKTYDEVVASESGRAPHPDPCGVELGQSGDTLTFRPRRTATHLEALGDDDENGYSARIRMLKPEGVELLIKAIAEIPEGGSLALYKGQLTTCYVDGDVREPADVADLWELCDDDMFEDDGADVRDGRGDHHHADDMALGDDDDDDPTEDELEERHEENLRDHEDFLRATAVPERIETEDES